MYNIKKKRKRLLTTSIINRNDIQFTPKEEIIKAQWLKRMNMTKNTSISVSVSVGFAEWQVEVVMDRRRNRYSAYDELGGGDIDASRWTLILVAAVAINHEWFRFLEKLIVSVLVKVNHRAPCRMWTDAERWVHRMDRSIERDTGASELLRLSHVDWDWTLTESPAYSRPSPMRWETIVSTGFVYEQAIN